jgi:pilus assembly protein Flp/PilA
MPGNAFWPEIPERPEKCGQPAQSRGNDFFATYLWKSEVLGASVVRRRKGAPAASRQRVFRYTTLAREYSAMNLVPASIRRFLASEDGPTAVEYAVMLALIVIVCLTAIGTIGTNANTTFTNVGKSLKK